MFGTGIDKFKDMLNIAVDKGLIVRSGSFVVQLTTMSLRIRMLTSGTTGL
jgi:hypothetical protein